VGGGTIYGGIKRRGNILIGAATTSLPGFKGGGEGQGERARVKWGAKIPGSCSQKPEGGRALLGGEDWTATRDHYVPLEAVKVEVEREISPTLDIQPSKFPRREVQSNTSKTTQAPLVTPRTSKQKAKQQERKTSSKRRLEKRTTGLRVWFVSAKLRGWVH